MAADKRSWPILVVLVLALGSCDRNLEPFDADERPKAPDLDRIFPETARTGPGLRAPVPAAAPGMRAGVSPQPLAAAASEATLPLPIRGRVRLAPTAAGTVGDGILFVIARRAGQQGGPPLAVVRIPGPAFPVDFEIGPANLMIPGTRFEGPIALSARLDADGNPLTRPPGEPAAALAEPSHPGDEVELVLKRSP